GPTIAAGMVMHVLRSPAAIAAPRHSAGRALRCAVWSMVARRVWQRRTTAACRRGSSAPIPGARPTIAPTGGAIAAGTMAATATPMAIWSATTATASCRTYPCSAARWQSAACGRKAISLVLPDYYSDYYGYGPSYRYADDVIYRVD